MAVPIKKSKNNEKGKGVGKSTKHKVTQAEVAKTLLPTVVKATCSTALSTCPANEITISATDHNITLDDAGCGEAVVREHVLVAHLRRARGSASERRAG